MKINGNGQAKILYQEEIQLLFEYGFRNARDKAIFATCLYTGCRISESLQLKLENYKGNIIVFPKGITKGKTKTRTVPVNNGLKLYLDTWLQEHNQITEWLFYSSLYKWQHVSAKQADTILKQACKECNIEGVSTHSFRRTALTTMSNAGVPLRVIQQISGHYSLNELQRYLEVKPEQLETAITSIDFQY